MEALQTRSLLPNQFVEGAIPKRHPFVRVRERMGSGPWQAVPLDTEDGEPLDVPVLMDESTDEETPAPADDSPATPEKEAGDQTESETLDDSTEKDADDSDDNATDNLQGS